MTRGTTYKLIALANLLVLATVVWVGVRLVHQPIAPQANNCPPRDAGNPWCPR